MYRLVVFDFDGTLANTLDRGLQVYNELAARHGFRPIVDTEAARALSLPAFLKNYKIPLAKLPTALREFFDLQSKYMDQVPLFDGVAATLKELHGKCNLGILSSNREENIRRCLDANQVTHYFGFVVAYRRVFGKATAMRKILKQQRLASSEMLYVGDEARDIEAAQKAGIDIAAVTWGVNAEALLAQCGPKYILRHPSQIVELLQGIETNGAPAASP